MTAHLPIPDRADPTRAIHPARPRLHPAAIFLAVGALVAALATGGCGDDDDEPDQSNQEALDAELHGLEDFAQDVATSTPAQVLSQPQVSQLLSNFGLAIGLADRKSHLVPIDFDAFTNPEMTARKTVSVWSAKTIANLGGIPYGTYERDVTSETGPFPGWLFQSSTPKDGFVFHFSEDDDFIIREGLNERHISGEIRFLQTAFELVGGTDLVMTATNFELVVDPITVPVIHVPFAGVLVKGTADYARVEFGDVSDPTNLTNSYFGTLAFDFLHDQSDPADIQTTLLAVDTTQNPDYVLLLDLDQLNVTKEIPEQITARFGCGNSNDPSDPALDVTTHFTDIVYDPKSGDTTANMTGTIQHRNRTIATLAGSTNVVQLDVDITGDGKVTAEDVCVDIDITFTDSGETQNICVAFSDLATGLPFLPQGSRGRISFGPITF